MTFCLHLVPILVGSTHWNQGGESTVSEQLVIDNNSSCNDTESGSSDNEGDNLTTTTKKSFKKYHKKNQPAWEKNFPWMNFDGKVMTCSMCVKHGKQNALTKGCSNFCVNALKHHARCQTHKESVEAVKGASDLHKCFETQLKASEKAALVGLHAAYWLAKEEIARESMAVCYSFWKLL